MADDLNAIMKRVSLKREKGPEHVIELGSQPTCKPVTATDTLEVVKPPVVRDELPSGTSGTEGATSGELILKDHLDQMNSILQNLRDELVMARTGQLPSVTGTPGEGQYYVTGEVAIQFATPNPPVNQAIDTDRICFDTLTGLSGPAPDGYQRERIRDVLKTRNAPKATVINDGTATIFVISSPNGRKWSPETPILPGEARTFFNVWELRLRSTVAGNANTFTGGVYRVTEYDFWLSYVRIISIGPPNVTLNFSPRFLDTVQGGAQPAALTPILGADLTPVNTPTTFRTMVAMSNAGTFHALITNGGSTQDVILNPSALLVASGVYFFDILVNPGDTVNFTYSATGGTIKVLRIQEIDAAVT